MQTLRLISSSRFQSFILILSIHSMHVFGSNEILFYIITYTLQKIWHNALVFRFIVDCNEIKMHHTYMYIYQWSLNVLKGYNYNVTGVVNACISPLLHLFPFSVVDVKWLVSPYSCPVLFLKLSQCVLDFIISQWPIVYI